MGPAAGGRVDPGSEGLRQCQLVLRANTASRDGGQGRAEVNPVLQLNLTFTKGQYESLPSNCTALSTVCFYSSSYFPFTFHAQVGASHEGVRREGSFPP